MKAFLITKDMPYTKNTNKSDIKIHNHIIILSSVVKLLAERLRSTTERIDDTPRLLRS